VNEACVAVEPNYSMSQTTLTRMMLVALLLGIAAQLIFGRWTTEAFLGARFGERGGVSAVLLEHGVVLAIPGFLASAFIWPGIHAGTGSILMMCDFYNTLLYGTGGVLVVRWWRKARRTNGSLTHP